MFWLAWQLLGVAVVLVGLYLAFIVGLAVLDWIVTPEKPVWKVSPHFPAEGSATTAAPPRTAADKVLSWIGEIIYWGLLVPLCLFALAVIFFSH